MDLLDMMTRGYVQDNPDFTASGGPPTMGSGQAPSILDLLSRADTAPPPTAALPEPDDSMLTPLALLRFAAQVTQPRMRGQSTFNKILEAGTGAAGYYMTEKKNLQDQEVKKELQKRALAKGDLELQQGRLAVAQGVQNLEFAQEKRPLELEALKGSIEKAKDDRELTAIQTRLAALKEKYAEDEIKAGLQERAAKTDTERATATLRRSQAQLAQKNSEELIQIVKLRAQGAARPKYSMQPGMPGEPQKIVDERTGITYNAPMEPHDALAYATQQVDARAEMGEFKKGSDQYKIARQQMYEQYRRGNVPQAPADPAAPKSGSAPSGQIPTAQQEAINVSRSDPKGAYAYKRPDGTTLYYIGGKEVTKEEVDRRMKKKGPPAPSEDDQQLQQEQQRQLQQSREIARGLSQSGPK